MIGLIRGMVTLSLLLVFIGLAVWAWSGRRRDMFEQMARLPLEEDDK